MTFKEYQNRVWEICGGDVPLSYVEWGLIAEIGEYAGKKAKQIRGEEVSDLDIKLDLGDIAWMIAVYAILMGENPDGEGGVLSTVDPLGELLVGAARNWHSKSLYGNWKLLLDEEGFEEAEILELNIKKQLSRKARGVVKGNGDHR